MLGYNITPLILFTPLPPHNPLSYSPPLLKHEILVWGGFSPQRLSSDSQKNRGLSHKNNDSYVYFYTIFKLISIEYMQILISYHAVSFLGHYRICIFCYLYTR